MHPGIHAVLSHIKWYISDQLDSFAVGIFLSFPHCWKNLYWQNTQNMMLLYISFRHFASATGCFFEYLPASSANSGFHWILSVPYTVHNLRPSPCFLLQTAEIPVRVRQTGQMLSAEPASCFQRVLHNQWQISVFPSNSSGFPPASEAFLWQADPDQSDKDFRQMPTSSDMGCPQNL